MGGVDKGGQTRNCIYYDWDVGWLALGDSDGNHEGIMLFYGGDKGIGYGIIIHVPQLEYQF